jgi:hypothetical protein
MLRESGVLIIPDSLSVNSVESGLRTLARGIRLKSAPPKAVLARSEGSRALMLRESGVLITPDSLSVNSAESDSRSLMLRESGVLIIP